MNFEHNPLKKHLHTLLQRAKADVEKRFSKANIGITPLQFGVLHMTQNEPTTLNEIARHFSFKAPSLVPAVDALEKSGLIERKNDTHDRRKILLIITPKGKKLLKRIPLDDSSDSLNKAFKKLEPAKQKHLLALLEELIGNL